MHALLQIASFLGLRRWVLWFQGNGLARHMQSPVPVWHCQLPPEVSPRILSVQLRPLNPPYPPSIPYFLCHCNCVTATTVLYCYSRGLDRHFQLPVLVWLDCPSGPGAPSPSTTTTSCMAGRIKNGFNRNGSQNRRQSNAGRAGRVNPRNRRVSVSNVFGWDQNHHAPSCSM